MDDKKLLENNTRYLDIAKKITYSLDDICIQTDEEYSGIEVLAGISIGLFTFINSLAKVIGVDSEKLYNEINRFTNIANNLYNSEVQKQEGVSGSEDKMVGEASSER